MLTLKGCTGLPLPYNPQCSFPFTFAPSAPLPLPLTPGAASIILHQTWCCGNRAGSCSAGLSPAQAIKALPSVWKRHGGSPADPCSPRCWSVGATKQVLGPQKPQPGKPAVPKGLTAYSQLFPPGSNFDLDRLAAPANLMVPGAAFEPCCLQKVALAIWQVTHHNRMHQVWSTGGVCRDRFLKILFSIYPV